MAVLVLVAVSTIITPIVDRLHLSLGVVAGVLVLACLGTCVFVALYDRHTWREVVRELERARDERAAGGRP